MDIVKKAQELAKRASEDPVVEEGLSTAESIMSLPGASASEEAQLCYSMALTNLSARATLAQAEDIIKRLTLCPAYQKHANARVQHGTALLHAAKTARPWSQGEAIAELFKSFPGYDEAPQLQMLHAQALFNVSVTTEDSEETVRLARKLRKIPAYTSSCEIQLECAKMLSNAIAWATSTELMGACVAWIDSMPGRDEYPPLAEAYARAERNAYRKTSGQVVPQTIPIGKAKMGLMERMGGANEKEFVVGVKFEGSGEVPPLELQVTATQENAAETAARTFCDQFLREKNMTGTVQYAISYCRIAGAGKEKVEMGEGAVIPGRSPGQSAGAYKVGIELDGPDLDFAQVMDITIKASSPEEARTIGEAAAKDLAGRMRESGVDIRICKVIDIAAAGSE